MVKNILIILLMFFSFSLFSQKLNEEYYLFSAENISENLILKNDTIIALKPIFRGGVYIDSDYYNESTYKYEILKDTLLIYNFKKAEIIKYKIGKNYLENSDRKEIYAVRSDFEKFPDLAIKYKEDIYWIDSPETSNGVITKEGKPNRKLKKIFKGKNTDNMSFNLYNGYEAYKLFGYEYIFGIIEVTDE
jgi:hypothetical protein